MEGGLDGVSRVFPSRDKLRLYIQRVNRSNAMGSRALFTHIEFVPTQLLRVNRSTGKVIEKAYPGPSILSILKAQDYADLSRSTLYGRELAQKMIRQRVSFEDFVEATQLAYDDILLLSKQAHFDKNGGNALALDYNPTTRKMKVVLVDHLEE
jgi:hypothetical protein